MIGITKRNICYIFFEIFDVVHCTVRIKGLSGSRDVDSRSRSRLHNQVDLYSAVILKRQQTLYESFMNLAQSILYSTFILICTYVAPAF